MKEGICMRVIKFLFVMLALVLFTAVVPTAMAGTEIKPDVIAKQEPTISPVPDYLLSTMNASIDLMNHLNRMDGTKAQETIKVINDKMPLIRAEAKKQNFPPFMVDVLENYVRNLPHTVAEGEYYEATISTNQMTSIFATMISYYNPRVPFILGHIDYLLQDVYIHSNFGEFDYAVVRYNDVWLDWKGGLIEDVKLHGGSDLKAQFESGMSSLEQSIKAKDKAGVENKVKELKGLVVRIEELYK
jgi:hypothetical protein